MAEQGRSSGNYPFSPDDIAAPAAQAESIAAANANEPMLEPRRSNTPRIIQPGEVESSSSGEKARGSGNLSAPRDHAMSSLSELDPEEVPPPAYSESHNQIRLSQGGLSTSAHLQNDGRINIDIKEDSPFVSSILMPALRRSLLYEEKQPKADIPPGYIPPSLGGDSSVLPPPPMNVVIHVVGSRGDVQPFVALGKVLKEAYGHRVRVATHGTFKDFVTENGLEFFCIGGDPADLMAFMVKNPGLMPGTDALLNGDVRKRRKGMYEIVQGCWRSCYEAGDGTDVPSTDSNAEENFERPERPFVADAIIANPPSFAHIHCAEKLGIPLHLMFTMPWSPTQAFPHPLASIGRSSADVSMTNFMSYALVELMTWQGLGDIINRFREKYLGLEPISLMWAPALVSRLRVPFTYCWSPALIPKPKDWGPHINVSGFYFLSLASNYQPSPELQRFLDAGPPPVYIGFGSIVVDDPNEMTRLIFEAVRQSGQRALVSKGWGGFGSDDLEVPENVFMLGNVPHDWLFQRVSCVVHHGGAGTTAAGIAQGCPTVIVPFFGDQPFWGAMISRAGAGPDPIPSKELTADKLAEGIKTALTDSSVQKAKELASRIAHEKGSDLGAKYFHDAMDVDSMRCSLAPSRVAVWQIKRTNVRLSALATAVIGQERHLDFSELHLYRPKELQAEETPYEPIGGATTALMGTVGSMLMGLSDIPTDVWRAVAKKTAAKEQDDESLTSGTSAGEGSSHETRSRTPTNSDSQTLHSNDTESTSSDLHPERIPRRPVSPGQRTPTGSTSPQSLSPSRPPNKTSPSGIKPPASPGKQPITMETAMDTTRGIGRFTEATLKSPMDFTLALAKGFRNAPRLYGDETVRPATKVTGIQSGLKASAKVATPDINT
jgi:UDP:flavonoid glycosyltransferase YjiC (YdhE family)